VRLRRARPSVRWHRTSSSAGFLLDLGSTEEGENASSAAPVDLNKMRNYWSTAAISGAGRGTPHRFVEGQIGKGIERLAAGRSTMLARLPPELLRFDFNSRRLEATGVLSAPPRARPIMRANCDLILDTIDVVT